MNIYYNGACFFDVKIEEVSCFYFCDHFYKSFKGKRAIKSASVLQSHPREEVIAYCCDSQEKIRKICSKFDNFSDSLFNKAKKNLIQYYPIVKWKGVCVINVNYFEPCSDHAR